MERWLMGCAMTAMSAFAPGVSAQTSCPQVLTYEGNPMWVDQIDTHLRGGPLDSVVADECVGTVVSLEPAGRRIRLRVRRGDHVEEHVTNDPASVATWIESWLMPVAALEPAEEPAVDPTLVAASDSSAAAESLAASVTVATALALEAASERETPPAHVEPEEPEPEWRIPVRIDALATFDADRTAPIWWGGEASIGIELRPKLWFAFAGSAQLAPKVNGETRRAGRFSLRSGWMSRSERTEIRVGLGFGVAISFAERETVVGGMEVETNDDQAIPMVEGYWDVRVKLSDQFGLVVGVLLRGNIPDGLNDRQPDAGDDPGEQLAPYPDARGSLSLRVGLSWGSR